MSVHGGPRGRVRCTALMLAAALVLPLATLEASVTAGAAPGAVIQFTAPTIGSPGGITAGPDGALWFTNFVSASKASIERITTTGQVTNYTDPSISGPRFITTGPDGALWFTNENGNSIGRITTNGVVTNYTDPGIKVPAGITSGPDGALWFTNNPLAKGASSIGRITTTGAVTIFTDPTIAFPFSIAAGPDGALWFTNFQGTSVGRITTAGVVTRYSDPTIAEPEGIAAGPDGSMWFTNSGDGNKVHASIGRITTSVNATPTWTIASSPNRDGAEGDTLLGVSCVPATSCMAVGSDQGFSGFRTLAESWDGHAWSIVATVDNPKGSNSFAGVSCLSASSCTAVGTLASVNGMFSSQTLIETWNGKKWSIISSPNPGSGHNELLGVSCVSVKSCTAVGSYGDHTNRFSTLVESWNGKKWSIVPSPNPGSGSDELLSVSCVSVKICTAAGESRTATGDPNRTLVLSWNGKAWSFVSSPNRGALGGLRSVSCVSASSCKAVGSYLTSTSRTSTTRGILNLSWNGHVWSLQSSPALQGTLEGVACISVSSCTAVGAVGRNTLVESWNGTAWSRVKSPNRPPLDELNSSDLSGVACVSPSACQAVGTWDQEGFPETLIEAFG